MMRKLLCLILFSSLFAGAALADVDTRDGTAITNATDQDGFTANLSTADGQTISTGGGGSNLLLDDYSGANLAYSVRLIDKDYTDALVRVRAHDGSSDQGEADIMPDGSDTISLSSTLANLDATATGRGLSTSSTLGDLVDQGGSNYSGYVTTWYDQSGNDRDATQTTAAEQPQVVSAGSLLAASNTLVAIQFDSGSDHHFDLPATGISGGANRSLFAVCENDASEGGIANRRTMITMNVGGGNGTRWTFTWNDTPNLRLEIQGAGDDTSLADNADAMLVEATLDGTTLGDHTLVADNSTEALAGATTVNTTDSNNILGGTSTTSDTWEGYMQEIIFWGSSQASNRSGINSNINTYYSLY